MWGSFSSYIYLPTPWAKHTKTTVRGAPSLGNLSCSKLDFSPPSLAAAVPAVLQLVATSCRCSVAMQSAAHCRALRYVFQLASKPSCRCPANLSSWTSCSYIHLRHDGTKLFAGQFQQCLHDVLCVLSPPELLCKDGRPSLTEALAADLVPGASTSTSHKSSTSLIHQLTGTPTWRVVHPSSGMQRKLYQAAENHQRDVSSPSRLTEVASAAAVLCNWCYV